VVARGFSVFNAEQVDGFLSPPVERIPESARVEEAERFSRSLLADIRQGMSFAFYNQDEDFVGIPAFTRFADANDYYAVLMHELTHWTGAKHRLDRNLKGRFGSRSYAAEELVAELGAAFLCAQLGLSPTPRPDHASYIANWIELLQNDKRAIFTAAAKAQQAVDWMLGCSSSRESENFVAA
jgi:antirestriction protein ArdC